jgi:hypothetical protein
MAKPDAPALLPYTRHPAFCPDCGAAMAVVTRRSEQSSHDAPLVWSCAPCKRSWSIAVARLSALGVDYDDGQRKPA